MSSSVTAAPQSAENYIKLYTRQINLKGTGNLRSNQLLIQIFKSKLSTVFCTKFGSNMCYSHWDRHTYASDLHLITSRELTSGFDFWLRGHLRFDVVHLPIQCDARYLYPVQSYWHFSEIQDGGRRHLGFSVYVNFRRVDSVVFVFRTKFGSNSLFFMCGLHSVMP